MHVIPYDPRLHGQCLLSGPTYISSSTIHLGTGTNMFLKDYFAIGEWVYHGRVIPIYHGFDCHGLPTENRVLKQCGLTYEEAKARPVELGQLASQYITRTSTTLRGVFQALGVTASFDKDHMYATEDPYYYQLVQEVVKSLQANNLLVVDNRILPVCTRCVATLANGQVVSRIQTITGVYYRFRVKGPEFQGYVVVWTTTPWTLLAHGGIAYSSAITYGQYRLKTDLDTRYLLQTSAPLEQFVYVRPIDSKLLNTLRIQYSPQFQSRLYDQSWVRVTARGTGFVNLAGRYSQVDLETSIKRQLPLVTVLDNQYRVTKFGVKTYQTAAIVAGLGVDVVKTLTYNKEVGTCSRCETRTIDLLSWQLFLKITPQVKRAIIYNAESLQWNDGAYKKQFLAWVQNAKSWCISRNRLYGIPICPAYQLNATSYCTYHHLRSKILDVWFEAGCAPLLIPHPSQYFVEGVDQIRGWLYVTAVLATYMGRPFPFKKIFMHGYLLKSASEKLSKRHLGPNADFKCYLESLKQQYHLDAIRMYLLANPIATGFVYDAAKIRPYQQKVRIIKNLLAFLRNPTYSADGDAYIARELLQGTLVAVRTRVASLKTLFATMSVQLYTLCVIELLVETVSRNYLKLIKPYLVNTPAVSAALTQLAQILTAVIAPICGLTGIVDMPIAALPSLCPSLRSRLSAIWALRPWYRPLRMKQMADAMTQVFSLRQISRIPVKVYALAPARLFAHLTQLERRVVLRVTNVRSSSRVQTLVEDRSAIAQTIARFVSSYTRNVLKGRYKVIYLWLDETSYEPAVVQTIKDAVAVNHPGKRIVYTTDHAGMHQLRTGLAIRTQ